MIKNKFGSSYFLLLLSIEIEWIPKIPSNYSEATVNGLNKVFLALAYSYVAGAILYWFTSKFPHIVYRRKMKPVVEQNIKGIRSCLHNMLLDFCVGGNGSGSARNPKLHDLDDCKNLLVNVDWSSYSKLPVYNGLRIQEAFLKGYNEMQSYINVFINDYKDVLTTKQLLLLEKIRHSDLRALINFGGKATTDFSSYAKEKIADMFCDIVDNYNKLSEN